MKLIQALSWLNIQPSLGNWWGIQQTQSWLNIQPSLGRWSAYSICQKLVEYSTKSGERSGIQYTHSWLNMQPSSERWSDIQHHLPRLGWIFNQLWVCWIPDHLSGLGWIFNQLWICWRPDLSQHLVEYSTNFGHVE